MKRLLAAMLLLLMGLAPAHAQKRIAFTFDDVPRDRGAFLTPDERTVKLIAALKRAGVEQAGFFVNPGFLERPDGKGGEDRILAYVAAGHVIASHSWDHPHLSETSAAGYLANIDRADAWLKGREGFRPWFRFPYLDEGNRDMARRDAIRAGLAQRGIHNGYVTADGADWLMESLTIEARRAGHEIDMNALRDFYVAAQLDAANHADRLARRELGRQPLHVMLLHETDLAALFIADFVAALRRDGWEIVTADAAFADPLNREFPDAPSANGTLLGQIAYARGHTEDVWPAITNEATMRRLFNERVLHQAAAAPAPAQ